MKLRNKKTGEIVEICKVCPEPFEARDFSCKTLAELNEEWEDYEESKNQFFNFTPALVDNTIVCLIVDAKCSREEAEKAVEKLKAWKRLKDKGFKFIGVRGIGKVIDFDIPEPFNHVGFDEYVAGVGEKEFYNDLLLLFGGKE